VKIAFPSREFDEAVAAVCHGAASDEQMGGVNQLLRTDAAARDEYILRLELHSRLASDPDLFASVGDEAASRNLQNLQSLPNRPGNHHPGLKWALALAACFALLATGWWASRLSAPDPVNGAISNAFGLRDPRVEAQRRTAGSRLAVDPNLLVHLDFEQFDLADGRLPNSGSGKKIAPDATIVGCQWVEGRWLDKRALEFRSVNDRVSLTVTGEFEALTLAAWVRVQGLDRQYNSLFMSDGFEAGTVHWLIRGDGVLGLTSIGAGLRNYQICASPPVPALNQLGIWVHLAVVLDGNTKRVVQFVNGLPVSETSLTISPPFQVGAAELGNWNASGFQDDDPSLIRNFSGAMDDFRLFSRALTQGEIRALYSAGKSQLNPAPARNRN
jgi:hypothetical protein